MSASGPSGPLVSGCVLHNQWMDCFQIWRYGRYGCEVVQEGFKIQNVGLLGCPTGMNKTAQLLSGLFLTNYSRDCSDFFYKIDIDI